MPSMRDVWPRPAAPRVSALLNPTLSNLLETRDELAAADLEALRQHYQVLASSDHLSEEYISWQKSTAAHLQKQIQIVRGRKARIWDQASHILIQNQAGLVKHL